MRSDLDQTSQATTNGVVAEETAHNRVPHVSRLRRGLSDRRSLGRFTPQIHRDFIFQNQFLPLEKCGIGGYPPK
jgi:hypothetical protein